MTECYDEAILNADVIIVYVQTSYHEDVIKKWLLFCMTGKQ